MLVLRRKRDQSVMVGDHIEVKLLSIQGEYVQLGFLAPEDVKVHRREVYEEIQLEKTGSKKKGAAKHGKP